MGTPITRDQLLQLRLAHHFPGRDGQTPPGPPGPAGVVDRMLAVQAQDFGQALWAVGSRVRGSTRHEVLAVLDSAEVVRSAPVRGTLHFVRPADLRWMLGLTAERMIKSASRRLAELDLDQRTLHRARDVAGEALAGGMALSRDEFLETLDGSGISTSGQRGYHIIWYLAQTQLVCWGPSDGSQQALVLLDEWAPGNGAPPDRDEALRRFVLRYFTGHGPARLQDFTWWSKLTLADAKVGLAQARSELEEYVYDGASYWALPEVTEPDPLTEGGLLLAGYDEYILGYQDRAPSLPPEYASRIQLAKNGVFKPSLLLDGRAVGTWRRNPRDNTADTAPFAESAISGTEVFDGAIAAYARFLADKRTPEKPRKLNRTRDW
ncbi:winged helix DNA-binding domain-containing protein [Arthrobacter tumbae]|uniref:winged helix DNA-binding domain-containing protein n=1 Tax=Arthrobacter tumbae TaxID=163874 RepID=UPI00195BA8D5|nr:winged helix DNA-binding domain-containing protein [Arthrobacter tumbae]MBM7781136.1 AcrR family transcriptional regulator [Arthrobacter tumbae]